MPINPDLEARGESYYVAGTRISLDSVACSFRRGETADAIFANFPALRSRDKLERVIGFIESHPREIDAYLEDKLRKWDQMRRRNPKVLVEKARKFREGRGLKSA